MHGFGLAAAYLSFENSGMSGQRLNLGDVKKKSALAVVDAGNSGIPSWGPLLMGDRWEILSVVENFRWEPSPLLANTGREKHFGQERPLALHDRLPRDCI